MEEDTTDFFGGIEMLKFEDCFWNTDFTDDLPTDFLNRFRKLKVLNFSRSCFRAKDLKILFENNPDIETFCLYGGYELNGWYDIDFRNNELEFGPKLKRLALKGNAEILQIKSLFRLTTNLTKLRLEFFGGNLSNFFIELAAKGVLEELELNNVDIDRHSFHVLKSLTKLQLLILSPGRNNKCAFTLDASSNWPPSLRHLRLSFTITISGIISTIKQLRNLENFDLLLSDIVMNNSIADFRDVSNILKVRDNKQKLKLILPSNSCGLYISENIKCLADMISLDGPFSPKSQGMVFPGVKRW